MRSIPVSVTEILSLEKIYLINDNLQQLPESFGVCFPDVAALSLQHNNLEATPEALEDYWFDKTECLRQCNHHVVMLEES